MLKKNALKINKLININCVSLSNLNKLLILFKTKAIESPKIAENENLINSEMDSNERAIREL
jgi:hypothetical protein